MNKVIITILILLLTRSAFGQTNKSLSEQLWDRVQNCNSMFEDMDEDGKIDYDILTDDSKNGYLEVAGTWPTCGCNCSNIVGAYKSNDGKYMFLEKETWSCSWVSKISSNKGLSSIFPENFGMQVFASKYVDNKGGYASLYLDVDIPRIGTDTKIIIKIIPFGMHIECNSALSFEYSEKEQYSNCKWVSGIKDIAEKVKNEETLTYILNGQFDKISQSEIDIINETIGDDDSRFKSKAELTSSLKELKQTYDLYSLIEYEQIILGWNKETARFFIKEKGNPSKVMTFKQFLIENIYWSPAC